MGLQVRRMVERDIACQLLNSLECSGHCFLAGLGSTKIVLHSVEELIGRGVRQKFIVTSVFCALDRVVLRVGFRVAGRVLTVGVHSSAHSTSKDHEHKTKPEVAAEGCNNLRTMC